MLRRKLSCVFLKHEFIYAASPILPLIQKHIQAPEFSIHESTRGENANSSCDKNEDTRRSGEAEGVPAM